MSHSLPPPYSTTHEQGKENTRPKQHGDSLIDELGIVKGQPVYPSYASLETRLTSFNKNWPTEDKPSIDELALAGFAFTGHGDSVRCYFCGTGIRNWQSSDCPWTRHALMYRTCGHVRRCKGDIFIDDVEQACGKVQGPCRSESDEVHTVLTLGTLTRMSRSLKQNSVAIEAATEFIESQEKIQNGVFRLLSRGKMCFTAIDLIEAIEEHESVGNSFDEADPEQKESLVRENEGLRQPVSCKICMDAMASVITMPCGHLFSCPQCIAPLRKCAVCRSLINGTVRVKLCTFNKEAIE